MSYDVIVVGAGPGGSAAAATAAKNGLKTLLIDREQFPRDKPCGDAVPGSCFRVMREMGLGRARGQNSVPLAEARTKAAPLPSISIRSPENSSFPIS